MPEILTKFDQGSLEWHKAKLGRPTASQFGDFMDSSFGYRAGKMPETYLFERLAERMTKRVLPNSFSSFSVEQGQLLEEEAIPFFEMETNLTTQRVGFVIGDDKRCGCSPDALISDDAGLEIKCPFPQTHLRYLDHGKLPSDYAWQVHGSLFVTGRKRWHFMSYHRGLPPLHVIVERDESIMAKIGECLAKFYATFDAALQRLTNRTTC